MLRVGLITGEYPPLEGGVGDFTRLLGRALSELGHEVHVITRSTARTPGLGPVADTAPLPHPVINAWDWEAWGHLNWLAEELRLDIYNIQYQAAAYDLHGAIHFYPLAQQLGWPLGTSRRIPIVTTFHDLKTPYLFPKAGRLRWWAVKFLARQSDAVIVTNAADRERLLAEGLGKPRYPGDNRLVVIPIGSNILPQLPVGYKRDVWRARYGVGPEDVLLGYFGFLNESKGVDTLLQALARLGNAGASMRLILIGGRTGSSDKTNLAYAEYITGLIQELGLSGQVRMTGYLAPTEVSALFEALDICVLPYRDGASFRRGSLLAALAHGCAIITTHPDPPVEELRHLENVYLVPPNDVPALAAAIATLAASPALCGRLGRRAMELSQSFRWERIAGETLALYERVLARR